MSGKKNSWQTIVKKSIMLIITYALIFGLNFILWKHLSPYDRVLIIGASASLAILSTSIILFAMSDGNYYVINKEGIPDDLIRDAYIKRDSWQALHFTWKTVYYLLTGLSILLSVLVLYIACYNSESTDKIILYSILSIILTTVSFILRPKELAYGFRQAFEALNYKLSLFSSGKCFWEEVLVSIRRGEHIITETEFGISLNENVDNPEDREK